MDGKSISILLVEDNPGDIRLTKEAFKEGKMNNELNVVMNGEDALAYLRKEDNYALARLPDLILLDLNMPKMGGKEVLKVIKEDQNLKRIPVVVLTTSEAEKDIAMTYDLHANCYITKPVDMMQFIDVVKSIEDYWFTVVKLSKFSGNA